MQNSEYGHRTLSDNTAQNRSFNCNILFGNLEYNAPIRTGWSRVYLISNLNEIVLPVSLHCFMKVFYMACACANIVKLLSILMFDQGGNINSSS